MNNNPPLWLRYGLIYGLVAIGFTLVSYYVPFVSSWVLGILGFGAMIFVMLLAGKQQRDDNEGYISFGTAFVTTFLTAFIGTAISVLFAIIMTNLIDTGLPDKLTEIALEQTRSTMEKLGTDEVKIDELIENVENNMTDIYTPMKQVQSLFISGLFVAIFAAIVSLFLRRERSIFADDEVEA
ncbi:MAG: DUF4199 domain-containing protein [Chitinophagales bacterium]|nr:DUF4199 domain-containing protein [Chitinophagales bacterium]